MANALPARGLPTFGGPSFHSRVGKAPQKILGTPSTKPASNAWGYPIPGYQSPTAASVMSKDYFTRCVIKNSYILLLMLDFEATTPGPAFLVLENMIILSSARVVRL